MSEMAEHVRGAVTREVDTNALFERFTIEEIQEIEKKTRQDIERKKEELRIMVGERYRELIEAADTITEMKNSAQNVMKSIGSIQDLCSDLRQTFQAKTFSSLSSKAKRDSQGKKEGSHFYSMSIQIKLLMDMPEKIWSALDEGQYLLATRLFLLARHVHTSLQTDKPHAGKVHGWFPVLVRQWATISHFRPTILQTCRYVLRDVAISDKVTAECLCSVLLLEDSTPRQVFNEFLLARSTSIGQLFQSDQGMLSIKAQICQVVQTIITTIHQIYTIFYDGRDSQVAPCNLLMQVLSEVIDKGERGAILQPLDVSTFSKYQSKDVFGFRPQLQQHATAIPLTNLQENCLEWIDMCKTSVMNGLAKLLGFITTVKGLAAIRDEVWEQLKQDDKMSTWDSVCLQVAKRKLTLWQEFFRPYFIERTKALLQTHFDSAVALSKHQIGKVLNDVANWEDRVAENERNLANYIWTEGAGDIPSNMAWNPGNSKSVGEGAGLMMKARAYTPAIQGLSKNFDSKIKVVLEDGGHYIELAVDPGAEKGSMKTERGPFDRFADREEIQSFMEEACQECVKKLLDHLEQQLYASKSQIAHSTDPKGCKIIIDRMLLLGRLCTALSELCPHLHRCMSPDRDTQAERPLRKIRSQSKIADNPKWADMKNQLQSFAQEAFKMWTNYMAKSLVSQFKVFLSEDSPQSLLRACTKWDEVQIDEEMEDGQKIKSVIRVPMQVSWYVQSLLYDLCEEINRIGGHALHRGVLLELMERLSDGVLEAYDVLLDTGSGKDGRQLLTQNRALQLCFDLKGFINIVPRKEDTEENRSYHAKCQKMVQKLDSMVDPFDLDVFMPYIQNHLTRHTQRSNILYGALMSLDQQATYMTSSKSSSSSVQQEQHNVLPLTTRANRFTLLPLSIQSRQAMSQPIIQSPKPITKGGPLMSPALGPVSPPPMLSPSHQEEQSSSFFGQMSTIWFSNVSGKNK